MEDQQKKKKSKKDKKKDKKRHLDEVEGETNEQDVDKRKKHKKDKKKSKKSKKKDESKSSSSSTTTNEFCFYKEHPDVSAMPMSEVEKFREKHSMTLIHEKESEFRACTEFDYLKHSLPDSMTSFLYEDFKTPTPIQAQCWPIVLQGRDVIGIAQTGSGKTLGFTLPSLPHIASRKPLGHSVDSRGPIMLVLSPTRELAVQSMEVCERAFKNMHFKVACIYGGVPKRDQLAQLSRGVHAIVATPGRLLALAREGNISFSRVSYLVLDEADRMLDLGFEPDIRAIVAQCTSPRRQTLLFSATWPESIQKLGNEFVTNPVRINIGHAELSASETITQSVEVLSDDQQKKKRLIELLSEHHKTRRNRILIFVLYKKEVGQIERFLKQNGYRCAGISSDYNQDQRFKALDDFKNGTMPLLIATDVAARGLDVDNVEHVINYSFPLTVEDYVHRIGRTGRGGAKGASWTFFTKNDKTLAGGLASVLRKANVEVPQELLNFGCFTKKKSHSMYGDFGARSNAPMGNSKKVKL